MNSVFHKLQHFGIIPVVVLHKEEDAVPLAHALSLGGLPCAEVTFRTNAAEASIRQIRKEFPDMLIGAGTILTVEQAECAVLAGADFLVSPGFNPKVVEHCLKQNICILPGVITPSEMEQAIEMGLSVVKFFPAEPSGGLPMLKALAAPYHMLRFLPTGGINPENVSDYLHYEKVIACGGSWMVKDSYISEGNFETITKLTKEAASLAASVRR